MPFEDCVLPARVMDHKVPEGRPVWANVTAYSAGGSAVKVTGTDSAAPATWTDPDAGVTAYPVTEATVYAYVPFVSVNTTDVVLEDLGVPFSVTEKVVPLGRPLSVKVTVYCPGGRAVKVIGTDWAAPATWTDPDEGLDVYPDTPPTVYAYVPFASVKPIVAVVEDFRLPARATDHEVADARPDSVNVTA
jgi:hypothetical protein